jgi:hypothetical protein
MYEKDGLMKLVPDLLTMIIFRVYDISCGKCSNGISMALDK